MMTDDQSTPAEESTTESAPVEKPARARSKKATPAAPTGYAIVETGGKQYRVKVGDRIRVERIHAEAGADISLGRVLLLGGNGTTQIGAPVVDGAAVTAHVEAHPRGEKIHVYKYKPKKRYRRKIGHRQELTELTITGITA
jgi:large subunit ribosomal protein L21